MVADLGVACCADGHVKRETGEGEGEEEEEEEEEGQGEPEGKVGETGGEDEEDGAAEGRSGALERAWWSAPETCRERRARSRRGCKHERPWWKLIRNWICVGVRTNNIRKYNSFYGSRAPGARAQGKLTVVCGAPRVLHVK